MHWRHIKIRNPLRQRSQTLLESLLAKEAAEKKAAEKERKKVEKDRRISLARLEGREAIWPRLKRFLRGLAPTDFWKKLPDGIAQGAAAWQAATYESEEEVVAVEVGEESLVGEEEVAEDWEGNWESVLEESDEE